MSEPVVLTSSLSKSYGDLIAVDKLDLRIEEGEVFGFLGPNGAGKTTTILMLMGLTEPTAGTVRVCGYDPAREPLKVKRMVGYFPEKIGFYTDLTARQNLRYTAEINGIPIKETEERVSFLLNQVGLTEMADRTVNKFSKGMRQRLGLADVLVKDPRVVVLDEPTSGIDPQGIEEILTLIVEMSRQKRTVILSSHQLHQVQRVCTKVGIMAKGKLVVEGAIDKLGRDAIAGGAFRIEVQTTRAEPKLVELIRALEGVKSVDSDGKRLAINADRDLRPQVAKIIVDGGGLLEEMKVEQYGLEEIYMRYFKEGQP
jgi:ABC-2 type transport system ATP-binding protein